MTEEFDFILCAYCVCQRAAMHPDVLEVTSWVEGMSMSSPPALPDPEEEEEEVEVPPGLKRMGRYRHSIQMLKPFRITHK